MPGNDVKRSSFPVKSYYITSYYKLLFDAINYVYGHDKGKLLMFLLKKNSVNSDEIDYVQALPGLYKNKLIEIMVREILEQDFNKVLNNIKTSPRIYKIQKVALKQNPKIFDSRVICAFRILPTLAKKIDNYADEVKIKNRDLIELSIEYFLLNISERDYKLIYSMFLESIGT